MKKRKPERIYDCQRIFCCSCQEAASGKHPALTSLRPKGRTRKK